MSAVQTYPALADSGSRFLGTKRHRPEEKAMRATLKRAAEAVSSAMRHVSIWINDKANDLDDWSQTL